MAYAEQRGSPPAGASIGTAAEHRSARQDRDSGADLRRSGGVALPRRGAFFDRDRARARPIGTPFRAPRWFRASRAFLGTRPAPGAGAGALGALVWDPGSLQVYDHQ